MNNRYFTYRPNEPDEVTMDLRSVVCVRRSPAADEITDGSIQVELVGEYGLYESMHIAPEHYRDLLDQWKAARSSLSSTITVSPA